MTTRFPVKLPGETVTVAFDFSAEAAAVSAPAVQCWTAWSAAGDQSDVRAGAPIVDPANPAQVLQQVTGGVDLTDYALLCTATGANGDVLQVPAVLPVRRQPA